MIGSHMYDRCSDWLARSRPPPCRPNKRLVWNRRYNTSVASWPGHARDTLAADFAIMSQNALAVAGALIGSTDN